MDKDQRKVALLALAFWGTLIGLPVIAVYHFGGNGTTRPPVSLPAYTTRLINEDVECEHRFQPGSTEREACLNAAKRRCLAALIHQPQIDVDDCKDDDD
jgi:hypothetical protein